MWFEDYPEFIFFFVKYSEILFYEMKHEITGSIIYTKLNIFLILIVG